MHIGIVRIVKDYAIGDGLLGLCPCDVGFYIRQSHGYAQLERVGVFNPLLDVAVINIVRLAERLC